MKKIIILIILFLPSFYMAASNILPSDTTYQYKNKQVVVSEEDDQLNIKVFHQDESGNIIESEKVFEGIYTEQRSIERQYESFEISIPDIFKPKRDRRPSRSHWAGFGVGFANLPNGLDYKGDLSTIINSSRSRQFNLNFFDGSQRLGYSNLTAITGIGIQFNSIHWQNNKAIEVHDYTSIITTTAPNQEYRRSRLHYTYLTFPLLFESNWNLGGGSYFFLNAGVVAKVKTASSSRIWWNDDNGRKQKTKFPGDLNIRPVTLDVLAQGGVNDFGFFVSYSPFSLFRNYKGPEANQATIGLQLYF
ncbi:MAG: hypothetical protein ITF98_00610 [Fermentimonas sp.]|jgi:hypothetical protein|nr:hypothetical protein [Fermentimonas sp.]